MFVLIVQWQNTLNGTVVPMGGTLAQHDVWSEWTRTFDRKDALTWHVMVEVACVRIG